VNVFALSDLLPHSRYPSTDDCLCLRCYRKISYDRRFHGTAYCGKFGFHFFLSSRCFPLEYTLCPPPFVSNTVLYPTHSGSSLVFYATSICHGGKQRKTPSHVQTTIGSTQTLHTVSRKEWEIFGFLNLGHTHIYYMGNTFVEYASHKIFGTHVELKARTDEQIFLC